MSIYSNGHSNGHSNTNSQKRAPEMLWNSEGCMAQTMSVSNDHATILLQSKDGSNMIRSLIKLSVLPTHTSALEVMGDKRGLSSKDLNDLFCPKETARIQTFLSSLDFSLNSESGAEYSFFDATFKTLQQEQPPSLVSPKGMFDQVVSLFSNRTKLATPSSSSSSTSSSSSSEKSGPSFRIEIISPASERQIQRAMPIPGTILIDETPKLYETVVQPYIQSIVDSGQLSWIDNILSGKKEKERLLLDTEEYILNIDTKWKTHPDPNTIPKEEWKTYSKAIDDLYCLGIIKEKGIASIRDLRKRHVNMLQDLQNQCCTVIEQVYQVPKNQLRIFFHYQPQFYHLHIHFTRLYNEIGCQVERGHLLSDVIQNLEQDDYYKTRTITYKLRTNERLYSLIQQHEQEENQTNRKRPWSEC